MMYFGKFLVIILFCVAVILGPIASFNAAAITIEKSLENPQQENIAQELFREIKCLSCEGQAIHDSDSEFARSMRATIREQIAQNKTKYEVLNFIEEKYGDEIFLKPPFKEESIIVWVAPFALLIIGILVLIIMIRKQEKLS